MSSAGKHKIRLLVVDDHEVVRAGLRTVLATFGRFEIVGEAASLAGAIQETERLKPDLVLLDVRLPDGSGFEAARELRARQRGIKILFLTSYSDDEVLHRVVEEDADGFLLKDAEAGELAATIDKIMAGESVLDASVTRRVLEHLRSANDITAQDKIALLAPQERRVLAQLAQGKTNKEIALAVGLSDKTVKNYIANAMEKLQMNRRSQVAVFCVRHGLVQAE